MLPLGRSKVLGQIKQCRGPDSAHGLCVCHLWSSSNASSSRKPSHPPPPAGALVPSLHSPTPGRPCWPGCWVQPGIINFWSLPGPPLDTCPALDVRPMTCAHGGTVCVLTRPGAADSVPARAWAVPRRGGPATLPTASVPTVTACLPLEFQ